MEIKAPMNYAIQVKNQQLERLNLIKFLLNLISKPKKNGIRKGKPTDFP